MLVQPDKAVCHAVTPLYPLRRPSAVISRSTSLPRSEGCRWTRAKLDSKGKFLEVAREVPRGFSAE